MDYFDILGTTSFKSFGFPLNEITNKIPALKREIKKNQHIMLDPKSSISTEFSA